MVSLFHRATINKVCKCFFVQFKTKPILLENLQKDKQEALEQNERNEVRDEWRKLYDFQVTRPN